MMNCREVESEIEIYAIGALPAEEMDRMAQHLSSCKNCQAALERYHAILQALTLEAAHASDFEPVAGHKDRFMQKLADHPQLRPGSISAADLRGEVAQPVIKVKTRRRTAFRRPQFSIAFATMGLLAILVVGLGAWVFSLSDQLVQQKAQASAFATQLGQERSNSSQLDLQLETSQKTATALNNQLGQQQTELASLRTQIDTQQNQNQVYQNISLLLNENGATTRQSQTNQIVMNVLMAPQDKQLALFAKGFPQLQLGTVYQLWLYKDGQAVRGPAFSIMNTTLPDGTAAITLEAPEPMANYTALLITIESVNATPNVPTPDKEIIRDNLSA